MTEQHTPTAGETYVINYGGIYRTVQAVGPIFDGWVYYLIGQPETDSDAYVRYDGPAHPVGDPDKADPGPWTIEKGITCVVCPQCAFTFAEVHEDEQMGEAGWYTCPVCDETGQLPDLGDDDPGRLTPSPTINLDAVMDLVTEIEDARPPDSMIAAYIEDLEQALADVRVEVRTRAEYIERVRPWAQDALDVVAPDLGSVSLIVTHDPLVRQVADYLTEEGGSDGD